MKFSKRFLSMLLAVALLLSLTACGGTNSGNGDKESGASSNGKQEDFFASIPSELKGTTLKYFMWYE